MIDELELLKRERPEVGSPAPEARRAARQALDAAIAATEAPRKPFFRTFRPPLARLAPVAALLVVVAVVAVFLGGHNRRRSGPSTSGGPELVFTARPSGPMGEVRIGAVQRAASLLQQLAGSHVQVTSAGDRVVMHLSGDPRPREAQLLSLVDITGRFVFYDWEAQVLTPGGKPVAGRLAKQDPAALLLSQGGGTVAPGSAGAGSQGLYAAVRLASTQPKQVSADNGRPWAEYFAFGAPGSPACATAARVFGVRVVAGQHCYLAGPSPSAAQAVASLPPGVSAPEAEMLTVPRGTVVLEAAGAQSARPARLPDPGAQFFVLRDHVALFGSETIKPAPGTDLAGSPNVVFGFTAKGAAAFQAVTARIAHRGNVVSSLGQTLNQHFAVAVGDRLSTVPSIDFKTYPDGVPGGNGADLSGAYTNRSAQTMTTELELGALPVTLELVSGAPGT